MAETYEGVQAGSFQVQAQERVLFGQPIGVALPAEVERYGAQRVFVVSTRSLAGLVDGPLQRVERALGAKHVGTFAAVRSHSPREDVLAAAQAARDAKADLLVSVGGGSVIDATKAVQLCLWEGLVEPAEMEPFRTTVRADDTRRAPKVPAQPIRAIAVSTTLSAAEFTSAAGITDADTHAKQSFAHRLFVPRSVVLDPAATLATPSWLLYCTGIRAVDHAVETYCAPAANLATEALSLQALRLLYRSLLRIAAEPDDLPARSEAQIGMWQSILPSASGVPTGASHGIGYVLGGTYGVAHGHTSCVMLPAVLRWNEPVNAARQRDLSAAVGVPEQSASELIADLIRKLAQPRRLREVKIGHEQLDEIAERALAYPPVRANPRPIRNADDVREILELAW